MSLALPQDLRFQLGARTLFAARRRLVRIGLTLEQALEGALPVLPPLEAGDHGYLVTSLPAARLDEVVRRSGGGLAYVRQAYARRYADLTGSFEDYLARFSGRGRSALRRKLRRFAELSGGEIDLRCYRTAEEIARFHAFAREVSRLTYQERLLGNGLPDGPQALAEMVCLAAQDRARGWLLFLNGAPVSYLYAPAEGDTLIYAHLGYDPLHAEFSPGTVLQAEAMRELMEERRFARFDFTEGDGQHKRLFATGAVDCLDLLLLRPGLANRALIAAMRGFDGAVAAAKRLGLGKLAARLRR